MPRASDFCPIFTDLYERAKNAKNTRGIGVKSKGNTRYTHTHDTSTICSAWLERPSPIESQGKDREVESLTRDQKITGQNLDSKRE